MTFDPRISEWDNPRLKTKAHWMSSEAFRKLYDEELNTYGEILKHSLPQK